MRFEETIQSSFDHYSMLFSDRMSVLEHLFAVIGNGYEWIDGQLVETDDYGEENLPINPLGKDGKAFQYNVGDLSVYELLEKINRLSGEDPKEIQHSHSIYPLSRVYSKLFVFNPDEIQPDWKEGIKEFIQYLISEVPDDSDTFRSVSKEDLKEFYAQEFE